MHKRAIRPWDFDLWSSTSHRRVDGPWLEWTGETESSSHGSGSPLGTEFGALLLSSS
jgi:hypothetical protein